MLVLPSILTYSCTIRHARHTRSSRLATKIIMLFCGSMSQSMFIRPLIVISYSSLWISVLRQWLLRIAQPSAGLSQWQHWDSNGGKRIQEADVCSDNNSV